MKKEIIFRGAATALITPFLDGEIDYRALEKIIEMQISGGISALVIGGTTGEAATLSDKERYELFRFAKEKAAGRVKLIFGTGTNDTSLAAAHTREAVRIGCDGVLVVTPYYNRGTEDGIVLHYEKICAAADIPVILYNVPSRTGVSLSQKQLERLAKIDTVSGIKEACDSADRLLMLSGFGNELPLYAGNDSQAYTVLTLGGHGVISVISNLYPEAAEKLCSLVFNGDYKRAHKLQLQLLPIIKAAFCETNPTPIKYAMSLSGLCSPIPRLPLSVLSESLRGMMKQEKEISDKILLDI